MEEAEVLYDFLPQSSPSRVPATRPWVPEGKGRDWRNDEPPHVGEDQVRDRLRSLKVHKSMGPE